MSRTFILRPVATTLLMVALFLVGCIGYRLMPLSALPEVDYPTIQVSAFFPGASADVMASTVTAPLEGQFGQMPGLKQMSSASASGVSVITLQFDLALSLDIAGQEVQAALNAANNLLPNDLPQLPVYSKVNPADAPIITLAASSRSMPLTEVQDLVDTRVAQKISQVAGVGLVTITGGQRPSIRVKVNPGLLAAKGLSMENVRTAIVAANVNAAKGSFSGAERAFTIEANDQLQGAEDFRRLILAWNNGSPLRLGDVADVQQAPENDQLAAWRDKGAALIINVQRQPGANVIQVVDSIKEMLPRLRNTLPGNVELALVSDRTLTIRASVHSVWEEMMLAMVLVVLAIYIFLCSARATLIPALALPLSVVGTFSVMYLAGFSVNNLSLMALTIATGFVVDDAIVMIENIVRHGEHGKSPMQAALDGSRQITFTIISLTISLIAVLIPLLFMGDVIGRLFREFSVTLAVAILLSAVISLTFTPMLCARILRPETARPQGRIMPKISEYIEKITAQYGRALHWVMRHQRKTLWTAVSTLILTVLLYLFVPKGLFPTQDTGMILGISEAPESISFAAMAERQQLIAAAVLEDPAVDSLSSFIGVDGTNFALNNGRFYINLKPLKQRERLPAVLARLQHRVADIPGISLSLQPVQDLTLETTISRTQYQMTLQDANAENLAQWAPQVVAALERIPAMRDVGSNLYNRGLEAYLQVDRQAAGRLGLSMADVDNALYNAFGQRQVSTIFTQANQYRVVLETQQAPQQDIFSVLGGLRLTGANGVQVPLNSIATVRERPTQVVRHRQNQFPAVTVSFNLAHGASLEDALKGVETVREELQVPDSVQIILQGAAQSFRDSLSQQVWLILAALITMYIVLGVLYESYIHPLTILSTLPSAGVGALLALWISGTPLDMFAILGLILLIGIVKKNAIMIVDFALEAEREQGMTPQEAIIQASLLRFRPIMMTTLAALFGALPLMIGTGVGSELRHPIGIALVGGLLVSQLLTLFTTPVIYLWFHRFTRTKAVSAPAFSER